MSDTITEKPLRITIFCSSRPEADRVTKWIRQISIFRVSILGKRGDWSVRTYMLPSEIKKFIKIKKEHDSK